MVKKAAHMCHIQPRSVFRQQARAIANRNSTPGYGYDNDRSASSSTLHISKASWCLPVGPLPALKLLGLDAQNSLLGPHLGSHHPEQWAVEDKCAS